MCTRRLSARAQDRPNHDIGGQPAELLQGTENPLLSSPPSEWSDKPLTVACTTSICPPLLPRTFGFRIAVFGSRSTGALRRKTASL